MNAAQQLHELGQSLWLDNITRALLNDGTSIASIFVSRRDVAVKDKVSAELRNRLGIAIAKRAYAAYRNLLSSPRWQKLAAVGALPQRLLWASSDLQRAGAAAFNKSWHDLMTRIAEKSAVLAAAGHA